MPDPQQRFSMSVLCSSFYVVNELFFLLHSWRTVLVFRDTRCSIRDCPCLYFQGFSFQKRSRLLINVFAYQCISSRKPTNLSTTPEYGWGSPIRTRWFPFSSPIDKFYSLDFLYFQTLFALMQITSDDALIISHDSTTTVIWKIKWGPSIMNVFWLCPILEMHVDFLMTQLISLEPNCH